MRSNPLQLKEKWKKERIKEKEKEKENKLMVGSLVE